MHIKKLLRIQNASEECEAIGCGDLYVTVYGGRTRKIGILLGKGLTFKEATDALAGVTLESIVVAERVARAIRKKAENGDVDLSDFPLLLHVDDVIRNGKDAALPWDSFTFEDR